MKPETQRAPAVIEAGVVKKPRGRPRKPNVHTDANGLSRESIIQKAAQLAQTESLDEISMVRVAREFGVVPGLIHYYVGSRDELLSGVINQYFRERIAQMPMPSGDWRRDMERYAEARSEFEAALARDPYYRPARVNLVLLLAGPIGDAEAARREARRYLEIFPGGPEAARMEALLQAGS